VAKIAPWRAGLSEANATGRCGHCHRCWPTSGVAQRPQEALALRWSNVRERTLLVEEALAHGQLKSQKTGAVA